MGKKIDLEVGVSYVEGEMSFGTVHELEETQVLEVAFGVIHALEQFTSGFSFSYTDDEKDIYTLILSIRGDTGREREELDDIVESTLVLAAALSTLS